MTKPPLPGLLTREIGKRTVQGRARLYHWLRLHYDELAAARADLKCTWADLAEAVARAGALDASGAPPKPEAVRKAWLRLEADKKNRPTTVYPDASTVSQKPPTVSACSTLPDPSSERTFPAALKKQPTNPGPDRHAAFDPKPAVMRSRLPVPSTKEND